MEQNTIVYLIGIFVGVFIIAIAPYIRKVWEQSPDIVNGWNHRYTALFIAAYVVAIVATAMVYKMNPLDVTVSVDMAFVNGLVLGTSSNVIVVEVSKWLLPRSKPNA